MVRVDAVVFDVDGTLYRSAEYERYLRESIYMVLGEMLGIDYREAGMKLESLKKNLKTVSLSVEAMGVDRRRFYELLAERVEPSIYIKPRLEVKNLLSKLREKNVKIGCHTNSGRRLYLKVIRAINLSVSDFDVIVTSDDADPKPLKNGYILLSRLLRVPFNKILYVGDRWEVEVKPAKELGMITALVYSRKGKPDFYLKDITEILKIIE
ncbi:MAG: HAD family hydrolase [Thaumarchaeota archaeon]|jgi:putative hydrolase of the HAD superfamily|nr:HAD family hydrolase [Candidatus Geocrenenecus arthurdayi]